ncbi:ABC transporter permease [Vallitalea pronyensis]|uniref:ABC transporter permease n=1 Tax=Vallitalea pronyensis TaxID=1348613 RepID=A0A8J8MJZ4_9FIRM|nr:ABC transporter permease [Vallitalea pronyensis]QUI22673.1 ABC transporter permease [Vallitalea pronyensis]
MRLKGALITDFKFQLKQGFYTIYALLIIMYMVVLSLLPASYKHFVLPVLIYSDPAFVGLFFIGGIIMLEKIQGVINYLVITPLYIKEYLLSKILSLSVLAVGAGVAITLSSGYNGYVNYAFMCLGVFLSSIFFILIGVMIVTKCHSLNQYIVYMIPPMLVLTLPCLSLFGSGYAYVWTILPSVAGLRILRGAFAPSNTLEMICLLVYLLLWNGLLFQKVVRIFTDKIVYGGE